MNVLKPAIISIGGRLYRKNNITPSQISEFYDEEDDFAVDSSECMYYDDEPCDLSHIEETKQGFRLNIRIPSAFFCYIIGKMGETKKRIERETSTKISIPRIGTDGDIVITGLDKHRISSALTRINVFVDTARQKLQPTHFLSIPLNNQEIKEKFYDFKCDVLRECEELEENIFQNPDKLHLTIGMLTLMDPQELKKAVKLLEQCKQEVIDPLLQNEQMKIRVQGIEYMNDDPTAVHILYAKVQLLDHSDRLQKIVDKLYQKFCASGLMKNEYDRVKLHLTVMNSLLTKEKNTQNLSGKQELNKSRKSFNASRILEKFGDFDFGEHHINTIHLSQRHHFGKDGFYFCSAAVQLP